MSSARRPLAAKLIIPLDHRASIEWIDPKEEETLKEIQKNLAKVSVDSESQPSEKEDKQIQSTSITPSAPKKKDKSPIWKQQGFASGIAYYKFTEGCQRIQTLIIRYEKTAPAISHRLQVLKRCLEGLGLTLDNRRIVLEAEGAAEEVEMDVEKTRKWKFRFLDLIIEMLQDESGMKEEEVMNVLLYTEVTTERFRKELAGES